MALLLLQVPFSFQIANGDEIVFQDRFPVSGPQKIWSPNDFTVSLDASTPDGDSSVFQRNQPGSYKQALSQDTFTVNEGEYLRLSSMVKIGSPVSTWATTALGFRQDNGASYFIGCNAHAPSIFSLSTTASRVICAFDTSTATPPLTINNDNWVEIRLDVHVSPYLTMGVKKWLGTGWSQEAVCTVWDAGIARSPLWRVVVHCREKTGENTTHKVDNVTVTRCREPSLQRQLTYGLLIPHTGHFGEWVIYQDGRYVMYCAINSSIQNGKPSNQQPGDPGTWNPAANSWWADRIWLTWHLGDGIDPRGWDASDGVSTPPLLMLDIGGAGEGCLIGDPSVVQWNGQWHMYYEGTDRPDGRENKVFHATAPHWRGPWTKQGAVTGLLPDNGPPIPPEGPSWPTVFLEDNQLYIYYTDSYVRLRAAQATDGTGQNFVMINGGSPVSSDRVNRGQVVKENGQYRLIHDNFGRTLVSEATSSDKFNFPAATTLLTTRVSDPLWEALWENIRVGLPCYLNAGGKKRIYYTGEGAAATGGIGVSWTVVPSAAEKRRLYQEPRRKQGGRVTLSHRSPNRKSS
jgi:hypothetical protein